VNKSDRLHSTSTSISSDSFDSCRTIQHHNHTPRPSSPSGRTVSRSPPPFLDFEHYMPPCCSYHALILVLLTWLYYPHVSRCVLFNSQFSKENQIDIDSCFVRIPVHQCNLHSPYSQSIQTPIFALATSTSFSHSSGVFKRKERACSPILSNSSFKRLLTIR